MDPDDDLEDDDDNETLLWTQNVNICSALAALIASTGIVFTSGN